MFGGKKRAVTNLNTFTGIGMVIVLVVALRGFLRVYRRTTGRENPSHESLPEMNFGCPVVATAHTGDLNHRCSRCDNLPCSPLPLIDVANRWDENAGLQAVTLTEYRLTFGQGSKRSYRFFTICPLVHNVQVSEVH